MVQIVTLGNDRNDTLRKYSALVPEFNGEIHALAEEMLDAMYRGKGIGLAAVQVGRLYRLFVTHVTGDQPRVFINPDILGTSLEQVTYEEGCLSIPGVNADVVRPAEITIQAWNEKGRPFSLDADGLLARVIQHEYDHLNGVLFIDRLDSKKRERLVKLYRRQQAEE